MCGEYEYDPRTDKMVRIRERDRKRVVEMTAKRMAREIEQEYRKKKVRALEDFSLADKALAKLNSTPSEGTSPHNALARKLELIDQKVRAINELERAGKDAENLRKELEKELNRIGAEEGFGIKLGENGEIITEEDPWLLDFLPEPLRLGGLIDRLPFSPGINGKLQRGGELFGQFLLGGTAKLGKSRNALSLKIPGDFLRYIGNKFPILEEYAYCLRAGHIDGMARTIRETGVTPICWTWTIISEENPTFSDYIKMHAWREATLYAFACGLISQTDLTHIERELNAMLSKMEVRLGLPPELAEEMNKMDEKLTEMTSIHREGYRSGVNDIGWLGLFMHVSETTRERFYLAIAGDAEG